MTDADTFRRDGYVVLKDAIPSAQIDACLEEIRVIFNQLAQARGLPTAASATPQAMTPVMAAVFRADQSAYLAAARLAQHMMSLHRMGCDAQLVEQLKALGLAMPIISTRPVLFFMADCLKIPGGYQKTPPHQDFRSIQGSLDGCVAWIPFADAGLEDYPLEVLEGSHRLGLLPTTEDVFGHRIEETTLPDQPFKPLSVKRGDAVVFSVFLVHRTGEKGGDIARMAASFRINDAAEQTFIDRNYPNPYTYAPNMQILHPGVGDRAQVEALFGIKEAAE